MKPIIRRLAVTAAVLGSVTLAGTGVASPSADASTLDAIVTDLGPSAKPVAAVTDAAGDIFVLNEGDATVSKIGAGGALTRIFASLGTAARPQALTIDPKGYLFVACAGTDSVTRISPTGTVIPYWAYDGVGAMPRGITSDPAGNVFAANWGASTITKITATGAVTSVFARLDPADRPLGLTADATGSVYVADTQTDRISRVSASGAVREVFASLPKGPGLPTGPFGVAVDPWGTVVVTSSSGAVSTFASDGSVLMANVALPPGTHRPTGVLLDAFGDAFVGDELSHGVTVLDATGSPATSVADFGPGSLVRAVTLSGSALFAADYVSGTVRRVELAPTLASPALNATVRRGVPMALDARTTGLATKLIVSVGVLPPGLTLDESTGRLSGTPTVPGTYAFDVVAANHWGVTPPQHEVMTVVR